MLVLAGMISGASVLRADTIYSSFGPGASYEAEAGIIVTNDGLAGASVAIAFTPTADYDLTGIEFVATELKLDSPAPVTIGIFADNGGQPEGQPLESFTAGGLGTFAQTALVTTVTSVLQPLLQAGTQYWVGMNAPAGDLLVWNQTTTTATGFSLTDGSGNWSTSDPAEGQGAVEIDGILAPVIASDSTVFLPETAPLWMMAGGLAAIARLARRGSLGSGGSGFRPSGK
jgi:hypothetical protein